MPPVYYPFTRQNHLPPGFDAAEEAGVHMAVSQPAAVVEKPEARFGFACVPETEYSAGKFRHASDPKLEAVSHAIWASAFAVVRPGTVGGGSGSGRGGALPALAELFTVPWQLGQCRQALYLPVLSI
jgi:hypothetical protein